MKKTLLLFICFILSSCSSRQTKLSAEELKVGDLIFTDPQAVEPLFKKTVILITQIKQGHIAGLILNKPGVKKLGYLLTQYEGCELIVNEGGTLSKDELFFIHKLGDKISGSNSILPGLNFMGDPSNVKEQLASNKISKDKIQFFRGYMGWSLEEFQSEFDNGLWKITPAKEDELMKLEGSYLWKSLGEL